MKLIKDLYKLDRQLLGEGYDKALEYINKILPLEVLEFKSGTNVGTWTVPNEWKCKEAWVKFRGKKIIDYAKNPLSVMQYSTPFEGKVTRDELKKHLYNSVDRPDAIPYVYSFYEEKWGVCIPRSKMYVNEEPLKDLLEEGEYEVFIDTELKPGVMKVGVHTIKGSDREILLFAHLDHPWQANDNLSGVACLIDLVGKLKCEHTIKIIFCPETIGSIAYALTQDISKVDLVIAVDIVGNDNQLTAQWSYKEDNRINGILDSAIKRILDENENGYKLDGFRAGIGSDEYTFNDPLIGIPGVLLTRFPYYEYHTSDDTPDIVKEERIKHVQEVIKNIIDIYEKDYIPVRNFKGPLMRSKYNAQTTFKNINRSMDYFIYNIDGKKYLSEICNALQINFDYFYELLEKLKKDNLVYAKNNRFDSCEI